MSDLSFDDLEKVFQFDEGISFIPYRDSNGLWTIGIGHLIGISLNSLNLSKNIIDEIFKEDIAIAVAQARTLLGQDFYNSLTPARKVALITMIFTLGRSGFIKFEETIQCMKNEDWDGVALHILQSKWARDVDPKQRLNEGRDDRIAYMFKTGEFHPDYKIGE